MSYRIEITTRDGAPFGFDCEPGQDARGGGASRHHAAVAMPARELRRMAEYQETGDGRLFFGVNEENELFMLDELARVRAELPQLLVDVCVWRPGVEWTGLRGTPVDALRAALAHAPVLPDVYVCGPPPLVEGAREVAIAAGVPDAQFASERFTV
nr:hypothetical protein [Burkholderia ambifaria]